MSKLEMIRSLIDYNEWANERVLDAAARLSEEEFSREQGASWGSIEGTLAHLVAAQIVWLDPTLDYRDSPGNPYCRPVWQLMAHVVNHGTQHRSETAMALTACGRSPGDIDYVYFELARAGGRRRSG